MLTPLSGKALLASVSRGVQRGGRGRLRRTTRTVNQARVSRRRVRLFMVCRARGQRVSASPLSPLHSGGVITPARKITLWGQQGGPIPPAIDQRG